MNKIFDSKWALRGTALLLAVLMYLYVISEENSNGEPTSSTEMDIITNVPLEVYYDDENLVVTGVPETVDIKIEGPSIYVQQAKQLKDYKVFVDLNSLLIGEHSVTIQTENFHSKLNVTVDPEMIPITIEEKITQEFRVDPEINNRMIEDGYVLKEMTADPQRVLITGAKSIIESISYVKATIKSDTTVKESFEQEANVIVLNRDLNKLDVSIEPEQVKVKVELEEYSRKLPVTLKEKGQLPDDVQLKSVTPVQSESTVFGTKVALDMLTELVAEYDLSTFKESGKYKAKILLPDSATKLSPKEIDLNVEVEKTDTTDEEADN